MKKQWKSGCNLILAFPTILAILEFYEIINTAEEYNTRSKWETGKKLREILRCFGFMASPVNLWSKRVSHKCHVVC